MILITTSRRPTKGLRTFCRDLAHITPKTLRINRGKLSLEGVAEKALELKAEKVIIVDRWRGGPGKIQLFKATVGGLQAVPPLIYLKGVKFQREFQTMPRGRRIKSLAITVSKASAEAEKFERALAEFLEVPLVSFDKVQYGKIDAVMEVGKEPSGYLRVTVRLIPENVEIGPRMIISHLVWDLELKP